MREKAFQQITDLSLNANDRDFTIAGYGNAAVKLHTVHNGMITKGHYYFC